MGLIENKSKPRAKLFATSMNILVCVNWVKQGDDVANETSKEAPFMLQQILYDKSSTPVYRKCNNR